MFVGVVEAAFATLDFGQDLAVDDAAGFFGPWNYPCCGAGAVSREVVGKFQTPQPTLVYEEAPEKQ